MDVDLLIPATAVMVAAAIPSILNHRFLRKNVGRTNGNGPLADMTEAMLLWSKEHSASDLAYQRKTDLAMEDLTGLIETKTEQIIDTAVKAALGVRAELETREGVVDAERNGHVEG